MTNESEDKETHAKAQLVPGPIATAGLVCTGEEGDYIWGFIFIFVCSNMHGGKQWTKINMDYTNKRRKTKSEKKRYMHNHLCYNCYNLTVLPVVDWDRVSRTTSCRDCQSQSNCGWDAFETTPGPPAIAMKLALILYSCWLSKGNRINCWMISGLERLDGLSYGTADWWLPYF